MNIMGISKDQFPLSDSARKDLSRVLKWIQWMMVSLVAVATLGSQVIGM